VRATGASFLPSSFLLLALALASALAAGCTNDTVTIRRETAATEPLAEPATCPPGAMLSLGGEACSPVGTRAAGDAAPAGFIASESGWGVQAVHATKACSGPTRDALGAAACAPIDDCDAAFPPAKAAVVVRAGMSLPDAIAAAPAGATVAVDRGTHSLGATTIPIRADLRIVGRCTRDVVLVGPASATALSIQGGTFGMEGVTLRGAKAGVEVAGKASKAELRRVYLEGLASAVRTVEGGTASVVESVVDRAGFVSKDPVTAVVAQTKSTITVTDSEVRGVTRAFTAFDQGTTVAVRRTVAIARGANDDIYVLALVNGAITIDESLVATERSSLAVAGRSRRYDPGPPDHASITVKRSELVQSGPPLEGVLAGAYGGASVALEESTLRHAASSGLLAFEAGSRVTLTRSEVVARSDAGASAHGLTVGAGAEASLASSAVVDARGVGVVVADEGSRLTLDRSLVTGTRAGAAASDDGAATSMAVVVFKDAVATMDRSALVANEENALTVGFGAHVMADSLVVDDTRAPRGVLGEGIMVFDDAGLTLRGSVVRRSAHVGLVVMRAGGAVLDSRFERNAVGINLWESALRREAGDEPARRELVLARTSFRESGVEVAETEMMFGLPSGLGVVE